MIIKYWMYVVVFLSAAGGYGAGLYSPYGDSGQWLDARNEINDLRIQNADLKIQNAELKLRCDPAMKRAPIIHSPGREF